MRQASLQVHRAFSLRPAPLHSPVSFRRVPRLALLVLSLLSSMLFASPQALSAVFVKNFGQSASDDLRFVQDVAQGFSTGDHAPGYTLTSVHLFLSIATASPDVPVFSVAIWSESGGTPNQLVGSLTPNSATLTAGGNQFNAPETGLDLEANTTYFIVADVSTTGDRVGWSGTSSNNEDTDRITSGFEIRDSSLRRNADDSGAWTALTAVRKMRSDGENKTAVSTPTFAIAGAMADEGDGITFTVTLNPAASEEVTVDYATSVETGDTAAQADFTANSGTLTFATGDTSTTFTVATLQDSIDETDETFTVTLSSVSPASAASLPADVTATGTIIDDDSSSVLSIADASADEGDSATFTVTLNPAVTAEVTVDYATSVETGDTAAQADFTANNGTLTFDAGDTTKTFTVATLEDSVDEVDETFTVTLSSASGANLASDATATGTITDDDQSTLSIADAGADEGDDITFTVTLDPVSSRMEAVEYETIVESGDTAVQADFAESYGTLDFAAGDSSKTFTVATTEDTDIERDETFTVFLGKVTGTAQTVDDMAIGTIRNDDQAVLGIADAGADEGDDITFTVTLNPAAIDEVTVGYATSVASGDTAVQADFTANSGTLTFAVGETAKTFTVATAEETTIEPDETFTVTLSNASGAILPADPTATGTIGDDDTPRVSIASGGDVAQEGTAATFTLTMSPAAPTGGLTVNVTVAEVERRTLETGELAYDFVAAASEGMKTVTFAAGDTSATLTVPTVDDDLYEAEFGDDNLLRATLAAGTGYAVAAGSGTAELTLRDGASRPVVSWKTAKVTVTEGVDTNADLELTLSHALVGVFIAQFLDAEVGASPASRTNDYLWSNTLQFVTFAPGTIEGTLQVPILDDTQLEGTETFEVSMLIDGQLPVTAASERIILVDILDTDTMQLEPSAVSARVVEGDAIDIKIDIVPSGACNFRGEYFVTATPSGDTATLADTDAVEQRFGPCDTTRTVSFATREDTDVTANRALSFTLATKAGTDSRITVVTDNVVEVAVIDDDRHATGAPAITGTAQVGRKLTASPGTIADGDGLTGATYTYTWIRVDGATETEITGTTGNGYTPVAADQGKTLKVRASFTDDEGFDEQRDSAATATVATAPTTPTFGIADASAAEGDDITFTVTLNPAAGAAATVAWATSVASGDTAAQADFTAGNGTLNFAAGDTSKTITVATVEDTASEADETFTVTLSSASSGTALPSDATATGTIIDDDSPRVSIASGGDVASEGTAATFTLTMSPAAPTGGLTVNVTVAEVERRTLEAGELAYDFVAAASEGMTTVDFAAGDTAATLTVPTVDDDLYEAEFGDDNLLRATLAAGTGYAVAAVSGTAELTLSDGAARPLVSWKTAKVTVTEGTDTNAALVLTLSHALVEEVAFTLIAVPSSASSGSDFTFVMEDADFAPGTTEVTTLVPIVDSPQHLEATEVFNILIAHAVASQPVAIPGTSSIQVEILDPDTMQVDPTAVSARVVEGDAIQITIDTLPSGICPHFGVFFVTVTPSGDTATLADADAVEQRFAPCVSTQTVSFATREDTDVTANRALSFTLATKAGTDSRITVVTDNVVEVAVIDDDGHATGAPAIAGTAQVGRKLTASPGTIADVDGLTGASYTYTWFRVDGATETEITGTTGNGYTPVAADQGKTLKVRASFTDDEGFDEQRESAATATVATAPTTPTFGIADASADEGESITFTVTLNPAAGAAATVAWATSVASGDTAAQADFTAGNGTLNFGVGDTSKTFTVATVEDTASEADETFTVTLSSASSGTALPSDATATGTIVNDDIVQRVSVVSGGEVDEGENAEFTLTLSTAAPAAGLSVSYSLALTNANPVSGRGHVAAANLGAKTVTVAAGDTTAALAVATVDVDDLVSRNSTLTLTLTADSGYVLGSPAQAAVTIDDTTTANITYLGGQCTATVSEADGSITLGVQLDNDIAFPVSLTYTDGNQGTQGSADYVLLDTTGSFEFPALMRTSSHSVRIVDDNVLENNENFFIFLSPGSTVPFTVNTGCPTDLFIVTITDDDTAELSISAPAKVTEGDDIQVEVAPPTGSCAIPFSVTVTLTPSGDTATLADADAVEQRFTACPTAKTVSFATREDTAVSANRALSFTLATKTGTDSRITVVTDNVVEVAVIDDDRHATGAPAIAGTAEVGRKLTASPGTIADGDGLTGATYSYTWIRVDGVTETAITGTTGNGYTPVAADQGKTLKVRASFTDDEGFDEQRESAETATVATAPTMPTFGIADASAAEGDAVTFTVTLNPAASAAATVAWATSVASGDTAVQADFTAGNGTLNFGVGDTSKTFTVATVEDTAVEPGETFTVTLSSASSGTALPSDATATGTIVNDDVIGAFAIADASAAEGDAVTFTVTHTPAATQQVTVDWATSVATGDTAAQTDFTAGSGTLTFAVGDTSKTFTVATVEDTSVESSETFTATLSNVGPAGAATLPADATATGTITDDDTPPVLSISVNNASIAEAAGTSTVTISTGSGPTFASAQTITLALTGTATETGDYSIGSKSLTLAAGTSSITTTVTAVDDNYDDDAETVVIAASNGSDDIGSQTITITDDDDPPAFSLIFQGNRTSASETGAESVSVTVSLGGSVFESEQTLSLEVSGTAREGVDYNLQAQVLTLFEGLNLVGTRLTVVDDNYDDDAETVVINVVHEGTTVATGTITITDDDDPPAFSLIVSDSAPSEAGEETSMLTVSLGSGSVFEFNESVSFELSGTAVEKDDYDIDMQELTIVGSENMVSTTFSVVDDNYDDDAETVVIDVVHDDTTVATGTITITDDDDAPVLSVTVNNAGVAEAAGTSTVTVSTGSGSTFEDEQTITLTLGGTATTGDDYTIGSTSLTLPYGEDHNASEIATTITAVQDKIDDDAETIVVNAALGSGLSAIGSATVTITDDDDAPVLSVSVNNASVAEAGGTSTVTVSTGSGSTFEDAQTITLTLTGTATEGDDFSIGSKTLTLPAGSGTAAASIATTITAVQDKIDDDAETIVVTASDGGDTIGTQQTVTITDDDAAPVLSLDVSSAVIAEAAGTSTVTVGTGAGSTFATDQTIALALGGTATVIDDYSIGATTLTLPAGVGTAAAQITTTITAVDDDFFEGTTNERLTVTGSRGGTDFGAARIITITENELAPKLTLTLADDSISEDGGSTTVTASVAPRTVDAFTVTFGIAPNAPATAADYDLVGTLAFAALSATPTGTVTVTANNNRVDRPDKTVAVTATSSESYFRATDAVTLTLEDEDAAPAPVLEVSVSPIAENAGAATVTVTTGAGSTFPEAMTVTLSLTGSATETADYGIVSKSLTLPAGSGLDVSTVITTVTGVDDIIDDDAETVLIDAAIGQTAVGARQSITITDDDAAPAPTIGVSPGAIGENGGISTVTVTTGTGSTFAADQTVTLTLAGTAVESADYTITSKSLTLLAGVGLTGSLVSASLTGVNDAIDEADTETILIDAAIGATAVGAQQSVSVEDDDAAPVLGFSVSAAQIAENGGVSTVTITTGAGSTFRERQTVTLSVADGGTAIEGSDYRVGARTLTLPAGAGLAASIVTTTVTGLDDPNYEGSADQTLTLSAAHGNDAVGTPKTIAIDDDEAPSKTVLVLTPGTISEDPQATNGTSRVSATVSPPSEVGFWLKTRISGPDGRFTWQAFSGDGPFGFIEFEAGETASVVRTHSIFGVDDEEALGDFNVNMTAEVIGFIPRDFAELPNPLPGIQAPPAVTLTVEDNDTADTTVTLSVDVDEVAEGAGATTVTVTGTLSGDTPAGATAITLSVASGAGDTGAVSGTDFTAVDDFQLTIAVGQTSATATFTLTPIEDSIDEPAETLTLSGAPADTGVGVAGAVTLAIADNDDAPALVLSVDPATIAEAGGTSTVTVTTGAGSTYAASRTVTLTLSGTATSGSDYTIAQTSLVLPAGAGTTASSVNTTITGVDDSAADPGETIIVAGSVDSTAFGEAQTVTITDDEGASGVTLTLTPTAVFEGGSSTVTARVSPVSPTAFTVTVSAAAESPADADDFTLNGTTLSFAANAAQSTGTVTIDANDDNDDSDDKTVTVSGTVSAAGVTAPEDVDLTIRDDDSAVALALEVAPDTLAEVGGTATVTVTTGTGSTFDTAQTVTLALGGTAVRGADYSIGATTLTLSAGATSVATTVTALADDVFEGDETLTVSGLIGDVGFGAERTITLTDGNTAPTITLVLTPDSIPETDGESTVTATLSGPSAIPLEVTVGAAAVAPAVAGDFALAGSTLSFAANATASTGEVTVTAADNGVDTPNKEVRVSGAVSDTLFTAPEAVLLTIEDDDEASNSVTVTAQPGEVPEAAAPTEVTVTATYSAGARQTPSDFTISVLSAGGADAALSGVDFAAVSDATLTIPANETSGSVVLTIAPLQDRISEGAEVLNIAAASGNPDIGVTEAPTLTITDDDEAPAPVLEVLPESMSESGGTAVVTVSTGTGSTYEGEQTVTLTLGGSATLDSDYTLGATTLTLPAGSGEDASSVTTVLSALDDIVDESTETIEVSASLGGLDIGPATTSIGDDDDAPALVLSVDPETVLENGGVATVTVSTGSGSTFASEQTVSLSLAGTANEDDDYTLSSDTLTLPAGDGQGASAVTAEITAVDDALAEGDETVEIAGALDGTAFGETQTLIIADNEGAARVLLVLSSPTVTENGGIATLRAVVSPAVSDPFTVTVSTTAVAPGMADDFILSGTTLSFAANATASTDEVTITAVDNNRREENKTITVSGTVSLQSVTAPPDLTLTLVEDDAPATVTLVLTPASIGENGGVSTVTATLNTASAEAFTVTVSAAAVDPAVTGDFTLGGATLSFAADATASTGEVTIAAVDNDVDAPDKTVTVSGSVSLEGVGAPANVTVTITDDDEPVAPETPAVTLVLTPASIGENGGVSTVTAAVSPASAEAFTVTVSAVAVDPAVAGDFTLGGATLSFAADATESTGEVTIAAVDNDVDAPDKTVTVSGSVSLDSVTAPSDGTLTITDDDAPPPTVERGVDISPTALTIGEGDDTGGSYSVTLIAEPSEDVSVTVSTPPGSGLTVEPARLTFTPDDWQVAQDVKVTAAVDDDADDRTVTLTHAASGAGYENVAVADVAIAVTDRIDPELPALSIADARGREADGQLVFNLTLNRAAQQPVSVQYATRDGTATAAEDYEAGAGTATIAAGETGAQIVVPLRIDLFSEPDETFALMLSRADGARLSDAQATGTIEDATEDGAASQQWLARFGRVAGGQVMAVIGDQIASNRGGESQVTLAGTRLTGGSGANSFGAPTAGLDRFGQGGFGLAPAAGWNNASPLSAAGWNRQAPPGERPWSGAGGIAGGLGTPGGSPGAGFGASGAGFGPTATRTMSGRELLANSAFLLNAGPGGGNGVAVWGRGAYTRFDNLGEGIQTGGDAVTATVGVDWACARCLLGIALSHTVVDATYGAAGQESGELESTVTGLYPYFGAQLTERFSVWGLVGQGEGELIATPTEGRSVQVDLESGLAGLGARGEIVVADNGFTLAVKTDALVVRTSTGQAEGILEAEGEYRRVRLGLEGAWLRELGENASLRSSLEVAAREDAGDGLNGLGVEVAGVLKFIDVAPGLSLDLGVRGLVSHESEDFEEWGVSGGFRYDPQPDSAAGPRLSLSHSRGPAGSGGLQQALWQNNRSRPLAPSLGRPDGQPDGQLSAEFAYGFEAFGALGVPWARVGTTGAGKEYRLGYSLLTHRGTPSLELGQSAFAREYRLGWAFSLRCRAQVAVEVLHTAATLGEKADTGFQIKFRSVAPGGGSGDASCETLQPLFASSAPR